MTRGEILFQPNDDFSFRLVGDYSKKKDECCGAVYLPTQNVFATPGGGITTGPSTIKGIDRPRGQIIDDPVAAQDGDHAGPQLQRRCHDWGVSGEGVYDFGWAELTSITAYRYNKYTRGRTPTSTISTSCTATRRRFLQPLQDV